MQPVKNSKVKEFLDLYSNYADLNEISALLHWESEVFMPVASSERRSKLISKVETDAHNVIVSKEFEEKLSEIENEKDLNETEGSILRLSKRLLKIQKKLPEEFVKRFSEHKSISMISWRKAKEENDFSIFEKDLQRVIGLTLEYTELKGYDEHPYNALLDDYEIGLNIKTVKGIFDKLVPATRGILNNLKDQDVKLELISGKYIYNEDSQNKIASFLHRMLGFTSENSRLDQSAHPFSTRINHNDLRITTRISQFDPFYSITSTMHESGHALYELGINPNFEHTPLTSTDWALGIHESQSRTFENNIGRSVEFSKFLYPVLLSHYPWLDKYTPEDIYNLLNYVKPSFIRTEADEVTYNLHIAMRFEIELGLIERRINVSELPELWNSKMKEYFGISPESVSEGVLQDIHWSQGYIGYFPTYTLGNVNAAQLMNKFYIENPEFNKDILSGDFSLLVHWLRENLHQYGLLYEPHELIKKVTGEESNPEYLIQYLENKFRK